MKRRWLKLLAAFAVAGPVGVVALQAFRAWDLAHYDFKRWPRRFVAPEPVPGLEALTLVTHGGLKIAASFVAPKNGVAVVVAHGAQGHRLQMWPDVVTLAEGGFGVLAFDWPGHGESEGEVTLGTPEREAFTAAVDFLAGRDDVKRIGAYGFSNGGGLLTTFVADEPRVRSLLCVGAWTDAVEQTRFEYRRWGVIRQWPAVWVTRQHIEGGNVRAIDAAPRLRGRPSLFLAGQEDGVVPPSMSSELANAAGGESRLIGGAGHSDFRDPAWSQQLRAFFAREP